MFNRYDEETINQRKRGILNFLEYIGNHSVLFTSLIFVKFFEVGISTVSEEVFNILMLLTD